MYIADVTGVRTSQVVRSAPSGGGITLPLSLYTLVVLRDKETCTYRYMYVICSFSNIKFAFCDYPSNFRS